MSAAMFAKMKELERRVIALEDFIRQANETIRQGNDNALMASASSKTLKLPEKGKAA